MITRKLTEVRVRIAPSPTGYFHIGTARTALYNWLFSKKNKGAFILRIEDTDKERSKPEYENDILQEMRWLGLEYEEGLLTDGKEQGKHGPYKQSERTAKYKEYAQQLLDEHKAYYCFCTKEELEGERQSQKSAGQAPKYSGTCRSLSAEEVEAKRNSGKSAVIRLKIQPEIIKFTDQVRGEVKFDNGLLGDIVIAKNLTEPLYNFSVVVDDYDMKISHVIRGEDHLANTPKQIAIAKSLNFPVPEYAHLPLILNSDRSKMSKRFGGTAMKEYREKGYLPESILNFLLLLGWHPIGDQEVFTLEQMVEQFDLSRIQKAGASFDLEKLNWFNAHYLRSMDMAELIKCLTEFGAIPKAHKFSKPQLEGIVLLTRERMKTLKDFTEFSDFFFELPAYEPKILIWKNSTLQKTIENLEHVQKILVDTPAENFERSKLENLLMPYAESKGKGDVLWPLRVALSGKAASPGPFEIMQVLGKKTTLDRIKSALERLLVQPSLY